MTIELTHVWKIYGSTIALRDVTVTIDDRSKVIVLGPNGSGKSTMLSLIVGAEKPSRGEVKVFGYDPWRDHRKVIDRISALLDRTSVYPWMSGVDLARIVAKSRGIPWSEVVELAEFLGVSSYWRRAFYSYSTGMKRKLLLLLTLVGNADLLILDEPFQGIDEESRRKVVELLKRGNYGTILIATHILPEELLDIATHVMKLELGQVIVYGSIDNYRAEPGKYL